MLAVLDVDFCRFLRILKVVWGFKGFTENYSTKKTADTT